MGGREMAGLAFQEVDDLRGRYITTEGFTRFMQIVHSLNTSEEGEMVKRTRSILAKALKQARKEGIAQIASPIPNNQRHAEKALRSRVYSKKSEVLGGNITILRSKRNGNSTPRPMPPTKSGRPRQWSERTKQLYGYQGVDAQFILYWLTAGTRERQSGVGRSDRKTGRYGNVSTSEARRKYFGGTHNVGSINPETLNPDLVGILERVVNGEIIPEIEKLYQELANK